ncbi:MAG: hypothetical protein GF329_12980 [Candidatus Lokiarchaeota archaeon]|nr:hypothetical protein [Candidatus Lokiarchaeota archaeon]
MRKISDISDLKKFKIAKKDILVGIKYARTLDELISLLERKINELS